jgi:hypothetical protein
VELGTQGWRARVWIGVPAQRSIASSTEESKEGPLNPIVPGHVGCVVIEPDGTRRLARAVPDPLAE